MSQPNWIQEKQFVIQTADPSTILKGWLKDKWEWFRRQTVSWLPPDFRVAYA